MSNLQRALGGALERASEKKEELTSNSLGGTSPRRVKPTLRTSECEIGLENA
jgi:hypothetical protein